MEMRVSSYKSRADLERYCELLDQDQKVGLEIVGTTEELAHLALGPLTSVHGIRCRATDQPTGVIRESLNPPKRIKGKGYGLNGRLNDLPKQS